MVRIGALAQNEGADVASTASMTLGAGHLFNITGTTTITSITIKPVGTVVTLTFASNNAIIRDTGNLLLNGDYYAENSGPNTLTLLSNGTSWNEIARFPSKVRSVTNSGTRDMTVAAGSQAITGLGFKPSTIMMVACEIADPSASVGFGSSTVIAAGTAGCLIDDSNAGVADDWTMSSGKIIGVTQPGGSYNAVINSFDDTGFTFGWQRNGTPSGDIFYRYVAIQ